MVSFARLSAARINSANVQSPERAQNSDDSALSTFPWLAAAVVTPTFLHDLDSQLPSSLRKSPIGDPSFETSIDTAPDIVQVLSELGPEATDPQNMASLRTLIQQFGCPNEETVARMLLMLAGNSPSISNAQDYLRAAEVPTVFQIFRLFASQNDEPVIHPVSQSLQTASIDPKEWNPDVLVQIVKEVCSVDGVSFDWKAVIRNLDSEELPSVLNARTFRMFVHVYGLATGKASIPGTPLLEKWRFPASQLAILSFTLSLPGLVDWEGVAPVVDFPSEDPFSPFRRVPLVDALVDLDARALLQHAINVSPDLVLVALAVSTSQANPTLRQQLLVTLISSRLAVIPSSAQVVKRIWTINHVIVEAGILTMWRNDPSSLPRILEVAQELQCLTELLGNMVAFPVDFILDLAILSFRREFLNLDKWLTDRLERSGSPFLSACIMYLAETLATPGSSVAKALPLQACAIIFKCLFAAITLIPGQPGHVEISSDLAKVYEVFVRLNPLLRDLSSGWDGSNRDSTVGTIERVAGPQVATLQPMQQSSTLSVASAPVHTIEETVQYPPEVDEEATSHFKSLYQEQMSVEQAVDLLRRLRSSSSSRNQQVYGCMIHTLFDEYRFLTKYPDRQLRITGMLFGALAQYSVLSGNELGMLLNHILLALTTVEAAPTPVGHLAKFGICALERCLGRMSDCPTFCQKVLSISRLKEIVPEIMTEVDRAREAGSTRLLAGQPSSFEREINAPWIEKVPSNASRTVTDEVPSRHALGPDSSGGIPLLSNSDLPLASLESAPPVPGRHPLGTAYAVGAVKQESTEAPLSTLADGEVITATISEKTIRPENKASSPTAEAIGTLVSSPTLSATGTPQKSVVLSTALKHSSTVEGGFQFASVNMDTLLAAQQNSMDVPNADVQDKIHFIFNNLSHANMEIKAGELMGFLDDCHVDFLAHYVVVKRASIEPNFHDLYIKFLSKLSTRVPHIFKKVLLRSHDNVKILLHSEKIVSSSSERLLLKSLGSWIGALTLGRNKPLLRKDLDIKELLLDAYSNGRLIAVVPFISKILISAKGSKIFKPTNPWLVAILRLLKEIYDVPDLKLNVKFELPLLTKELGIDANGIEKSDLLHSRPAPTRDGNPDFTAIKKHASSPSPVRSQSPIASPPRPLHEVFPPVDGTGTAAVGGRSGVPLFSLSGIAPLAGANVVGSNIISVDRPAMMDTGAVRATVPGSDTVADLATIMASAALSSGSVPAGNQSRIGGLHRVGSVGSTAASGKTPGGAISAGNAAAAAVAAQQAAVAAASAAATEPTIVPNLAQYVTISPSLIAFQSSPRMKRLVPLAIDRAVREIIHPVVERSSAIATITTKELVLKDFAHEVDGSKIQNAAKQMVQQLAGSLALVTCKEPLRVSMGQQFRPFLLQACGGDQNLVEQTVQILCTSNLDIGCAIIERAATEKAARDISDVIASAFNTRRQQQLLQQRQSLGLSTSAFVQDVSRVYEDFGRLARAATPQSHAGVANHANGPTAFTGPVPSQKAVQAGPMAVAPFSVGMNASHTALAVSSASSPSTIESAFSGGRQGVFSAHTPPIAAGVVESDLTRFVTRGNQIIEGTVGTSLSSLVSGSNGMAAPAAMAEAMRTAAAQASYVASSQPAPAAPVSAPGEEKFSTQQVLELFNSVYPDLIAAIVHTVTSSGSTGNSAEVSLSELPMEHEVQRSRLQIAQAVKKSLTADEASMAVAQKLFKGLYEGMSNLHREVHVALLESMRECSRRLSKELVSWLAYSEDAKKLHRECIIALLRPGSLLHITSYDELVAKTCDNGRNTAALDFAAFLVRRAIVEEPLTTTRELYLTLELLSKVGRRPAAPSLPSAPEGLETLVETCRKVVHRPASSAALSGHVGGSGTIASAPGQSSSAGTGDGYIGAAAKAAKFIQDAESLDPPGSRETVASVLTEWQRVLASGTVNRPVPEHVIASFVTQAKSTTLYNDETRDRFLRVGIDLVCSATSAALKSLAKTPEALSPIASAPYTPVEAMTCLVSALCRTETSGESVGKGISLLSAYLQALVRCIVRAGHGGDVRAHFRLFHGIITELSAGMPPVDPSDAGVNAALDPDAPSSPTSSLKLESVPLPNTESSCQNRENDERADGSYGSGLEGLVCTGNFQVLSTIAVSLNSCNPNFAPGFAFGWLQLMSSRDVMPRLLAYRSGNGWQLFRQLLVSMLSFLSPHLGRVSSHQVFSESIRILYKGTLRVLLVLLHDFPEFLCAYHAALCDVIPPICIQLRNLVLSAYPRTMRLPDPLMPNLKVDKLAEMAFAPRILSNITTALVSAGLKVSVDKFLGEKSASTSSIETSFCSRLLSKDSENDASPRHNIPAINALVLYLGQHVIARTPKGSQPSITGPSTVLLQALIENMDAEGQYHLFNAIANQLRYPNSHTHYFSCVLLLIFRDSGDDQVKEQITRVLVERLIANRPHPWGLLITFIELIKNPTYKFWNHDFVRCASQIEELFENVARFCSGGSVAPNNTPAQSSVVSSSS